MAEIEEAKRAWEDTRFEYYKWKRLEKVTRERYDDLLDKEKETDHCRLAEE